MQTGEAGGAQNSAYRLALFLLPLGDSELCEDELSGSYPEQSPASLVMPGFSDGSPVWKVLPKSLREVK